MKRHLTALALSFAFLSECALATTLLRMDLDDLTAESQTVVYGKIAASRTEWNADRTLIYTVYTVESLEYLKGPLGPVFELREPGGESDGLIMSVAGVPIFQSGQEVVLFVWTDPQGQHQATGFEQGALEVQTDPQTGLKMLNRSVRLGSGRSPGGTDLIAPVTSRILPQLFNQIRISVARTEKTEATQ